MAERFEDIDYWKAIILYGLNQATYKIAFGKTLLELAQSNQDSIDWDVLSKVFLDHYIQRLSDDPMPQQANLNRRTVMERIITQLKNGIIAYNEAIKLVGTEAFNDVVPRFQTIVTIPKKITQRFYDYDHGKKLYLHDSIFKINETNRRELLSELNARWSLLEGAFKIGHENWELTNDIRETYICNGYDRTNLTKNVPFLTGYQGNVCFYCGEVIVESDVHVDHVLPRQVLMHDEIWNLVLSHDLCNWNKDDSLVGKHYIEKLIARNENIMGSNHPWKRKIAVALGNSKKNRIRNTWLHYENVKIALNGRYWENSPHYNRSTDPFFRKLITHLNKE